MIIIGIYSAFKFDGAIISIDLKHVTFVKFLRDDCGIGYLIFASLLSLCLYLIILFLCNTKKILVPFAILFYLYFVYSQFVIITSVILHYGIFASLIVVIIFAFVVSAECFIMLAILLDLFSLSCGEIQFKDCFSFASCNFMLYSLLLISLTLAFSIILYILKSFILILVF
ncbi:MAG: hypothetical protein E7374_01245 [Clostridiales bacterium]|nr:hypothetical protein [Clostridiales bacterium]